MNPWEFWVTYSTISSSASGWPCHTTPLFTCFQGLRVLRTTSAAAFGCIKLRQSLAEFHSEVPRRSAAEWLVDSPLLATAVYPLRSSFQICGFCPLTSFAWDYPPYPHCSCHGHNEASWLWAEIMQPAARIPPSLRRTMVRLFVQNPVSVCFNPWKSDGSTNHSSDNDDNPQLIQG